MYFASTDEVMQHAAGIVGAIDLDWQCGTVKKNKFVNIWELFKVYV